MQRKRTAVWIVAAAMAAGLLVGLLLQALGNPYLVAGGSLLAMCIVALLGGLFVARGRR